MNKDIENYNNLQTIEDADICNLIYDQINVSLSNAESKIWHAHPVWLINGNPIVGYSKLKNYVRLLFWSGQSFDEDLLQTEGSFKAAEMRYTSVTQVKVADLKRWLIKAVKIQWDYKNLIKRNGVLERLK